jgi:ABC-type nitrate/sulfonate/bicarbonate transport system substrate-binding protein
VPVSAGWDRGWDRRTFLRRGGAAGLLALGGGSVLLAACGDDDSGESSSSTTGAASGGAADLGTLTHQFGWVKNAQYAGAYFADQNGHYAAEGFSEIELIAGGPNVNLDAVIAAQEVFVGSSVPDISGLAIIEGAENILVGARMQKTPMCILSLAVNSIETPEDMYGKRIGVQAVNEPVWAAFVTANNLDESRLEKVPVQFDPAPLVAGEVDGWFAFFTSEPMALEAEGIATTVMLMNDFGYPMVAEVYVVHRSVVTEQRDKLKAFLRGEIKGWWDAYHDSAEGARLAVEEYGQDLGLSLEAETLGAEAQNELIFTEEAIANGIFTMSDEVLEQTMSTLHTAGIDIEVDDLFDLSIINEVYEENPELKDLR